MAIYETPGDWEAAQGGGTPSVLFDMVPPVADLVITATGGIIDNGSLAGLAIDGYANLGDNSASGGPVDAIKEHVAGYVELSALKVTGQCQLQQNISGAPWPKNGTPALDGMFLRLASQVKGDITITCKMSHDHPGGSVFTNSGIGLVARRISDPTNYIVDTRTLLGFQYSTGTGSKWTPILMGPKRALGTSSPTQVNTTPSWARMARVNGLYTFAWRLLDTDPWITLNADKGWDVAGETCEVGFGWGGTNERNVIRIYQLKIEGVLV